MGFHTVLSSCSLQVKHERFDFYWKAFGCTGVDREGDPVVFERLAEGWETQNRIATGFCSSRLHLQECSIMVGSSFLSSPWFPEASSPSITTVVTIIMHASSPAAATTRFLLLVASVVDAILVAETRVLSMFTTTVTAVAAIMKKTLARHSTGQNRHGRCLSVCNTIHETVGGRHCRQPQTTTRTERITHGMKMHGGNR